MNEADDHYIDIISHETGETIKTLGPYASGRLADRAESGLTRQIDHERFYSRQRKEGAA